MNENACSSCLIIHWLVNINFIYFFAVLSSRASYSYSQSEIKGYEMDETYSTHGSVRNACKISLDKPEKMKSR
jgi:hypothetical protein